MITPHSYSTPTSLNKDMLILMGAVKHFQDVDAKSWNIKWEINGAAALALHENMS